MAYAPGRRDRGRKETDGVHSGDLAIAQSDEEKPSMAYAPGR